MQTAAASHTMEPGFSLLESLPNTRYNLSPALGLTCSTRGARFKPHVI